MNPAIESMLSRYKCVTAQDYENAFKEIIQEIALLGLWRAKFFKHAAFYGGTALRILYQLDRFSEDLRLFTFAATEKFILIPYLTAIQTELNSMGFSVNVEEKNKNIQTPIESAFIKAGTKEHLLKISVPKKVFESTKNNKVMSIKVEVDTDPPDGFETEVKTLLQPIPFSVKTYREPDLLAGKIHAILQRNWKNRVKGRDYYDFIWFISRDIPVNLAHLEQRLRQSGAWTVKKPMQAADLHEMLYEKFGELNIEAAKKDILPFVKDRMAIEIWSRSFFQSLLSQLKTV